jgi:alpha-N-arabinofuranosidase
VNGGDASQYSNGFLPVVFTGNVYTKGSVRAVGNKTQKKFGEMGQKAKEQMRKYQEQEATEQNAVADVDFDASVNLINDSSETYLKISLDKKWLAQKRELVTGKGLAIAIVPDLPFENVDGTELRIDVDYFGEKRNVLHPSPGPFEITTDGLQQLTVWQRSK